MAQPILKRRLNPLLLISTVAALSLLAGVSVISQDQISQANQNASETLNNLKEIRKELEKKEKRVQRLKNNISSKRNKSEKLEGTISNLEEKVENKSDKISDLENEIENANNQIDAETLNEMNQSIGYLCLSGQKWADVGAAEFHCEKKWKQELGNNNES